jgi:hypothetical protein
MFTEVWCTHCRTKLRVQQQFLGLSLRCPKCSGTFVAQDVPTVEPAGEPRVQIQPPPRGVPAPPRPEPTAIADQPLPVPVAPVRYVADDFDEPPADFPAVEFTAVVKSDPAKALKGMFKARVTAKGLSLGQGKKHKLVLAVGTPAEYAQGNRFTLSIDGRDVTFVVMKFGAYQARLARDVVAFLSGRRTILYRGDYGLEWYLFLPAVLPLGIPVMTLGGGLPFAVGFGLAGACLGIAQIESLPVGGRIALSLFLTLIGYVVIGVLAWTLVLGRWAWAGAHPVGWAAACGPAFSLLTTGP